MLPAQKRALIKSQKMARMMPSFMKIRKETDEFKKATQNAMIFNALRKEAGMT